MDNNPEFPRQVIIQFKAADALLVDDFKRANQEAEAQRLRMENQVGAIERTANAYQEQIAGRRSPPTEIEPIPVSPEIDSPLEKLRDCAVDVQDYEFELYAINGKLRSLQKGLEESLVQEAQERERLERERQANLERRRLERRKSLIRRAIIAGVTACVLATSHFWHLSNTVLLFSIAVDGKEQLLAKMDSITLDGLPFKSGDNIKLGPHRLVIALEDFEPFQKKFWTFYGQNQLGSLAVEPSTGALSVAVSPTPAKIILRRNNQELFQGDAPLKIDKLKVGDYSILIRRGQYQQVGNVQIIRHQLTVTNITLDLGGARLSSEPPDAEFRLSGNNLHWEGNLPTELENVPSGNYQFTVTRKGWVQEKLVSVVRGKLLEAKVEFPYGTIEVQSNPSGLVLSANGQEMGKAPMTMREVKPGLVELVATDGKNTLRTNVTVEPKGVIHHTFDFPYRVINFKSIPVGADVFCKGKYVGTTPLTFKHIYTDAVTIDLYLDGFQSTNFTVVTPVGAVTNLSVKLISEQYLGAMREAQRALKANSFEQARKAVAEAIESDPADTLAKVLLAEIIQKGEAWKRDELLAERLATEAKRRKMAVEAKVAEEAGKQLVADAKARQMTAEANAKQIAVDENARRIAAAKMAEQQAAEAKSRRIAAQFAGIAPLVPSALIESCWNQKHHEGDGANRALAVPIEAGINLALKPFDLLGRAFGNKTNQIKQMNNELRFDLASFRKNWQGKTIRYEGIVASVRVKDKVVEFEPVGSHPKSVRVEVFVYGLSDESFRQLKPKNSLIVIGEIADLTAPEMMTLGVNRIILRSGRIPD